MEQELLLRSVVRLHSYCRPVDFLKPYIIAERVKSVGTGSIIRITDNFFYILTCSHCVDNADSVTVMLPLLGMMEFHSVVVALSPDNDLALVALPTAPELNALALRPLPLGTSVNLRLGQKLVAVGYPLGQTALKVSDGVYAGFQERLQHTVSISPGNSGGPLLNERGELVGVNNSGVMEASNVGFAVPIEMFLLDERRMFAQPPTGGPRPERVLKSLKFGFTFNPITVNHLRTVGFDAKGGVYISNVIANTPAARAHLEEGDIILKFDVYVLDNMGDVYVEWNYQKVRFVDALDRVAPQPYEFIVWKAQSRTQQTVRMTPVAEDYGSLQTLYPPYQPLEYTILFGLVIMPLTLNHIADSRTLIAYFINQTVKDLATPRLVVTHVVAGSVAQTQTKIETGDEITHVNNHVVKTLSELNEALANTVRSSTGQLLVNVTTHNGKIILMSMEDAIENERNAEKQQMYTAHPFFVATVP